MTIRSQKSIYPLLEKHLRVAAYPVTVTDLMDIQEIRDAAMQEWGGADKDLRVASNKLSDALGFMWRRGLLTRFPAPKEERSFARYAYIWEQQANARPVEPIQPTQRKIGKIDMKITEIDDGVLLELERFSIMIKPR